MGVRFSPWAQMKKFPKIIVICGQTATGKSDLAVKIAKKIDGEVISADSRQIYKGLDIGSGKITKKEMCGIKHHLLDIENPAKKFSVSDYKNLGEKAIQEIIGKGKTPIICGGTGFYIDALVNGIILPEVKPDKELRKKLEKKSLRQLLAVLTKLDKKRAKEIDLNNKVRIIRAIEIAKALGKTPKIKQGKKYDAFFIGLTLPKEKLQEKINIRLLKRISGMIREAKKLHKKRLSWRRMNELGLEYRYLALLLQNKISKKEFIGKLNTEIWHYAKRQMTWFKRNKDIKWFEPKKSGKIIKIAEKFLSKKLLIKKIQNQK